jgi:hypothetical protein
VIRRILALRPLKLADFVAFGNPAVASDADLADPGHRNARVVAIFRSTSAIETHLSRQFRSNA